EVAQQQRPEVILLDIGLPKINGFEACRRIRANAWADNILIIALTGWGQEEYRRKSAEAGFDRHLVKPVDLEKVMKPLARRTALRPPARVQPRGCGLTAWYARPDR